MVNAPPFAELLAGQKRSIGQSGQIYLNNSSGGIKTLPFDFLSTSSQTDGYSGNFLTFCPRITTSIANATGPFFKSIVG